MFVCCWERFWFDGCGSGRFDLGKFRGCCYWFSFGDGYDWVVEWILWSVVLYDVGFLICCRNYVGYCFIYFMLLYFMLIIW